MIKYEIFDRNEEIERLNEIYEISKEHAQFTVVTSRKRIGKTRLLKYDK